MTKMSGNEGVPKPNSPLSGGKHRRHAAGGAVSGRNFETVEREHIGVADAGHGDLDAAIALHAVQGTRFQPNAGHRLVAHRTCVGDAVEPFGDPFAR